MREITKSEVELPVIAENEEVVLRSTSAFSEEAVRQAIENGLAHSLAGKVVSVESIREKYCLEAEQS